VPGADRDPTSDAPRPTSLTTIEQRAADRAAAHRARRRDEPNTVIWWHLANVIDLIHFPIVIALVFLGASYFSGPVFVFLLTLMVTLQVAVLGCPVMWLTGQLRKIHDPEYEVKWSFTAWLYQRYGRWFGVAVFLVFAALTLVVRFTLF
jgi:hypothetical protein